MTDSSASDDPQISADRNIGAAAYARGTSSDLPASGQYVGMSPSESMGTETWLAPAHVVPLSDGDARDLATQKGAHGDALLDRGDFHEALEQYRQAVDLNPSDPSLHYRLACAARQDRQPELAERHLLHILRSYPGYIPAHHVLAVVYHETGRLEEALRHSSVIYQHDPLNFDFILVQAAVLSAAQQKQAAWELLETLVASGSKDPAMVRLYAQFAPDRGDAQLALDLIQRALARNELSQIVRGQLHFDAAALLERVGRYDHAFEQATLANQAARRPFDPAGHAEWIQQRIRYITRARLRALPRATHENRRPVFIVGMPRSGTSLVEQMLASHPAVFGAGELEELSTLARRIPDEEYPRFLETLSVRRANSLAEQYLSAISAMNSTAAYVTDKMPANFLRLDLVELLFPGCRVIHCMRNPLDTCVSCYFTDFAEGNEFSFELAHLGVYYRGYQQLMSHWKKVLSLPILDVRYEDLVLDTQRQVCRILDFLNLPWDDRCLRFHETRRWVRTASEHQVHRPIYTSSIGRWRHYEKHLSDLLESLVGPGAARDPVAADL